MQIQAVVKKYDILFIADEVKNVMKKLIFVRSYMLVPGTKELMKRKNHYAFSYFRLSVHLEGWGPCLGATNTTLNQISFL